MKLVLADTLFEPLQLLSTNTGAIANTTSTQRDFIPMLILGRKFSTLRSFKVPSFNLAKLQLMREQTVAAVSSAFQT
jgi:hypothetical protein